MGKKIFLWILVIAWMGLIFYFSAQNAQKSTIQSRGLINKTNLIDHNTTEIEKEVKISKLDTIIRKIAHAGVFLVLGVLVCFLLKEYTIDIRKILVFSFIICILYACSDEFHQLYVYGRSGEIKDVLIDSFGLCIGLLIFYLSGLRIWRVRKND